MERTSAHPDQSQSVHSPASVSSISGLSRTEQLWDRRGLLAFQGEPAMDRTHPYTSPPPFNHYDTVPIDQSQPTAASVGPDAPQSTSQPMQQVSFSSFLFFTKIQMLRTNIHILKVEEVDNYFLTAPARHKPPVIITDYYHYRWCYFDEWHSV